MKSYWNLILSALTTLFLSSNSWAAAGITFDGTLTESDGDPLASSNVQFKYQIRTPGTEDCLLYEEIQTQDLSATNGHFALSIGDGSGVRQDLNSWTLFEALSNRQSFSFSASDCTGVNTYTPNPTDNRKAKVFVDYGSGWEAFPAYTLNYTPMSIESYAVGGFPASSLFRVEDAGVLGNVTALTTSQYNNLVSLANGSSSIYEKQGQLGGSPFPALSSGQSFVSDGSGGWTASTPLTSETDPNVSAFAKTSLPTCGAGEVLKSDGTVLSCVTDTSGTLPNVGTPGTYTKVTTDAQGRVTSGSQITGSDITSGTIGGSTAVNTSGNIQSSSEISAGRFKSQEYLIYDSSNTNYVTLRAPTINASYDLIFPSTIGTADQILGFDITGNTLENKTLIGGSGVSITHSAGGITISATGSGGTVTSVTGTSPIQVATGTSTPMISVDNASTTAKGVVTLAADGETTAGKVVQANDSRLAGIANKLSDTLAEGKVFIGDASNKAVAQNFGLANLKTAVGTQQWPATSCTISQTLTWTSITDALTCSDISIASAQVTGLDTALDGKVDVAGDTMTGVLNLPPNGLNVGSDQLTTVGGKVGIGTSAPMSELDVAGTINAAEGTSFTPSFSFSSSTDTGMFNPYPQEIGFSVGGNEALRINSFGNVGIGTTTPQAKLHVMGAIVSGFYDNGSVPNIDWSRGNIQVVDNCMTFTLNGLVDGGIYRLIVEDSSSGTCSFTDINSRAIKHKGGSLNFTTGTNPVMFVFTVTPAFIIVEPISTNGA